MMLAIFVKKRQRLTIKEKENITMGSSDILKRNKLILWRVLCQICENNWNRFIINI